MSTDPAAFVAGVPVKISERFRPPRRVTIPASCQYQINPDLLTQDYDFAIEKTTLKWVQERLQPGLVKSGMGTNFYRNDAVYNANPSYESDTSMAYPGMLQPTPIPSQKNNLRSPLKTPADINFAEFEGEGNDPFDSAALKSINDMEELAKVLDSTNMGTGSQSLDRNTVSKQNSSEDKRTIPTTYPNGQVAYNAYGQYPYYLQQQLHHTVPQPGQNFGQFTGHLGKNSPVTSAASPVPSYNNSHQYGGGPDRSFQNTYYPQQWNNSYSAGSPNKGAPFGPYDYRLQANNSVPSTSQGVLSPSNITGTVTAAPTVPVSMSSGLSNSSTIERGTVGKRQDLEDFYTRYYSPNKSTVTQAQQSGVRSGDSTPSHSSSSGALGSTTGSLRSCRSVPDLSAAEDSEVTSYNSRIPSAGEGRGFSHTPPPRPSSTGLSGLEDWKPLPDLPSTPESSPAQHSYQQGLSQTTVGSHQYTPTKTRLPDPFIELTADAQALVQSMAEMGFPRPRVARAVQKLGTDHKKLIEVLLVLQNLQDAGEDEYKAERAFYHYMGDLQKTKDHLAAAKQLCDLGFEDERIVDALLKHDNDRDKALEELIA
ncbi:Ubiquitin-associated protein 1 [Penaeus vannamei]|uniref:Ubiquitin-associated protein 1 n=1 Tax=Penaeus vannamei TaxID=6689 RepID=A0A423SZ57_PENVA|nr:Ubiquitin-associated protein 1 [Penaeus vannamei]